MKTCPKCGANVEGLRFCGNCGYPLTNDKEANHTEQGSDTHSGRSNSPLNSTASGVHAAHGAGNNAQPDTPQSTQAHQSNQSGQATPSIYPAQSVLTGRTDRLNQSGKPNYQNQAAASNQNSHSAKDPFYKQTWFLVLTLFLFPPLSLICAVKYKRPADKFGRTIIVVLDIILTITMLSSFIGLAGSSNGSHNSTQQSTASEQSASQSDNSQSKESAKEEKAPDPTLTSISATYKGSTAAGTKIDSKASGIVVKGAYSDGSSKTVYDWSVSNPASLEAEQTQNFVITSGSVSCPLSITCTTLTPADFKASCESVDYASLARNASSYKDKPIAVTGKVMQVISGSSSTGTAYLVEITPDGYGYYSDPVYVQISSAQSQQTILEKDIVDVYGTGAGMFSYTTALNVSKSVPAITASYIDIE
jgi:hypothetical protein